LSFPKGICNSFKAAKFSGALHLDILDLLGRRVGGSFDVAKA